MNNTIIKDAAVRIVDNLSTLNEKTADLEQEVAVLDSRMDVFTALPEGATTNDAALEDIKVGFDGTVYEGGPGDAVRAQVSQLNSEIANITENNCKFFVESNNLVRNMIFNKSLNTNTGNEADSSVWCISDFIEVANNTHITAKSYAKVALNSKYRAFFFKSIDEYISCSEYASQGLTEITDEIPQETQFIRFAIRYDYINLDEFGVCFGNSISTEYENPFNFVYEDRIVEKSVNQFESIQHQSVKGKKFLILGDSITYLSSERGWTYWVNKLLSPSKMIKVAVNGAKWRDTSENQQYDGNPTEDDKDNNVIGNQVQKVINNKGVNADYDDFDIIIIACGTNDIPKGGLNDEIALIPQQFVNGTTPISVDDVDRTTFGGAMRYAYDKLSNLYPNAKFFISTPIQGAYATRPYVDIKLVGDIEKAFCEYQSIQAIDTFNCGICGLYEVQGSQGKDLLDGLHPIESGGKKMGYYIANAIKRYYDFN